ncbi:sensory box histidine kinase/response regulator [Fimbriiglobus ruber]|uniref:Sensory box histidine kinase/response regulator n=1 Tax=Fimbriiglobus ruber TaxID=1908690 RepID=A0A225DZY6_9BACT|nr:sensory box histidine kinase/response regulator [Fimbriiglobus ruber]
MLRVCGFSVLEAEDGQHALRLAKEYRGSIHLLVTDVMMPRLSGKRLAEAISIIRPETPVLFISGSTSESLMRDELIPVGVSILAKPFAPQALMQRVRGAISGAQLMAM